MKVVFLLQDSRSLYGAEQATLRLVSGLKSAGADVRAILMEELRLRNAQSPLADSLRALVDVDVVPLRKRWSPALVRRIRETMASSPHAILHSTGYKADCHAAAASNRGSAFPLVATVHGWLFRRNLKERLFQELDVRALRTFSRVVVLSRFYESYLRRRGFHPLQLARIPAGFDPGEWIERPVAQSLWSQTNAPFVFGALGRLSQEKNHALLLRAAAVLAKELDTSPRPWSIRIAGDGPLLPSLRRLARRLDVEDRVEWLGWSDSNRFFRSVHVLVQPSRVENQPQSVMEAMAWLRPVLATRSGGLPELVSHGETGWLVPDRDARAMARAMKDCLVSPERARAAGERGRDVLERNFPFAQMVDDHLGLYDALLAGFRRNPRS